MRRVGILDFFFYHALSIIARHFEQLPAPPQQKQELIVELGLSKIDSLLGSRLACLYSSYFHENCRISRWREGPCSLELHLCALHNANCVLDRFSFQI